MTRALEAVSEWAQVCRREERDEGGFDGHEKWQGWKGAQERAGGKNECNA